MPLILILIGVYCIVVAGNDNGEALQQQIVNDFTGSNNFLEWMLALLLIGALGFVPKLKPFADTFLALIIVAIFLSKGTGFFAQLTKAFTSTSANPTTGESSTS
jgi:hypothetical protein